MIDHIYVVEANGKKKAINTSLICSVDIDGNDVIVTFTGSNFIFNGSDKESAEGFFNTLVNKMIGMEE